MSNFILGNIVTLKSHPYFSSLSDFLICADEKMIPPLMVVIEIFNDNKLKNEYDEKSGVEQTNQTQLKCIFYSHKSHKYEEDWFLIGQIKKIEIESVGNMVLNDENEINKFLNKEVILKSWNYELRKKKASLNSSTLNNNNDNKVTGLLSFLPPVMFVTGIKKVDDALNNFDKKTGKTKRLFSKYLLKCKWFNPLSNSFSEGFITPDALELLNPVDEKLLEDIQKAIQDLKYLKFNNSKIKFNDGNTIGRPIRIYFNHCYYELEYYDFLTNKNEIIKLNNFKIDDFKNSDSYTTEFAPSYDEVEVKVSILDLLKIEIEDIGPKSSNKLFRINYTNLEGVNLTRTISDCKFYFHGILKDDVKNFVNLNGKKYIQAKCFKRNGDERFFRFDGIIKIDLLDL